MAAVPVRRHGSPDASNAGSAVPPARARGPGPSGSLRSMSSVGIAAVGLPPRERLAVGRQCVAGLTQRDPSESERLVHRARPTIAFSRSKTSLPRLSSSEPRTSASSRSSSGSRMSRCCTRTRSKAPHSRAAALSSPRRCSVSEHARRVSWSKLELPATVAIGAFNVTRGDESPPLRRRRRPRSS